MVRGLRWKWPGMGNCTEYVLEIVLKLTGLCISQMPFMTLSQVNTVSCCFLCLPKVVMICTDLFLPERFCSFQRFFRGEKKSYIC